MTPTDIHQDSPVRADAIHPHEHAAAREIATRELNHFLDLVSSLSDLDWQRATDCTAWNVRDILAHQAGAYAGGASFAEFRHQMSASRQREAGEEEIDAINRYQLAQRVDRTPAELIEELSEVGPRAIANRHKLPWIVRKLPLIPDKYLGRWTVEYLNDVIFPRDTWSHRMDICRATGRPFIQDPNHDGRLLTLVMYDIARKLKDKLNHAVELIVTGAAGGRFLFGPGQNPEATIVIDFLSFNRLASERTTVEALLASGLVELQGDEMRGRKLLGQVAVAY